LEEGEGSEEDEVPTKKRKEILFFLLVANFIVYVTAQPRMGKLSILKRVTRKKTVSRVCNKRIK
jgi:hypothetical protein